MRGMKTLDMRMKKHCENGLALAEFLTSQSEIEEVRYPALKTIRIMNCVSHR